MSSVEERLAHEGFTIPTVATPLAAYTPAVRSGSYVYVSGQLPFVDGELPRKGKVGVDLTAEDAADLARICALNAIAAVRSVVADLDQVVRVVKVVGFVASAEHFTSQPLVVNGASNLLVLAFGEGGVHARSAVGVMSLPLDAPVEVEMIVEVAD